MTRFSKIIESEAEEVLKLWDENALESSGRGLMDDEAKGVLALLRRYATHPEGLCLVAEEGGRMLGFVTARVTTHPVMEGTAGEIEELYVRPQARRRGIGSRLVREAVQMLRQQGAATIRAQACADSQLAKVFWQAMGWEADLVSYSNYEV